jgi:hypothetical protein
VCAFVFWVVSLCNANEKYTRNRMRMRQVALQSQRQKHKGKTIRGKTIILIILPKMVLPSNAFCFCTDLPVQEPRLKPKACRCFLE